MLFSQSKKIINIVIKDYVIRFVENIGSSLSTIKLMKEKPIPMGLIENGKITDEMAFFDFMRGIVKEYKLKHRRVRFYVPNALVIMRQIEFPAHLQGNEIKERIRDQIGNSLHLPFKKPIFDIHPLPAQSVSQETQQNFQAGILFAAPEEELLKYTEIFDDVSLKPIAADVQALGVYRYFYHLYPVNLEQVYLFIELNMFSINLSIYHNHQVQFLRFENLDLHLKGYQQNPDNPNQIQWEFAEDEKQVVGVLNDQVLEIERVMNFYRFSLQKGEKQVNEIILLGDHPQLDHFHQKLLGQFNLPVTLLKAYMSKTKEKEMDSKLIPALGLALKGGANHASRD